MEPVGFTTEEKMQLEDLVTELFERGMSRQEVREYILEMYEEFADKAEEEE